MQRQRVFAELRQDLSYSLRMLRRNIALTVLIVGGLAMGIGANTAIFTLIDAVLLRRLPVDHPEQLIGIGDPTRVTGKSTGGVGMDLLSWPLYQALTKHPEVLSAVAASGNASRLDVRIDPQQAELEHPRGRWVSGNYFAVLGVPAFRGRTFDPTASAEPGGSPTVVISHGFWTRRFQNDPAVIGRSILIDGIRMTIIGVTPESFTGEIVGLNYDIWLPATMHDVLEPGSHWLQRRSVGWLLLIGRLHPGATLMQAQQRIPQLLTADALANSGPGATFTPGSPGSQFFIESAERGFSRVRETFHAPLVTLMIGVALLLCIVCGNVANLLFARAVMRGREMAVRLALGADRARLVRQLLTESAVLAVVSASFGLFIAWSGSEALVALVSPNGKMVLNTQLDVSVLGFTVITSILAVGLFGLVPALRASSVDLASSMRGSAASLSGWSEPGQAKRGPRLPITKLLIVGQVALSVLLLSGAALLVRSLRNVEKTDVGFDRDHLLLIDVDMRPGGYIDGRQGALVHALRDRLLAVPGVTTVTYSVNGLFNGTEGRMHVTIPGFTMRSPSDSSIAFDYAGPDYARTIGASVVSGRDFSPIDENRPGRTALVNKSFAEFYWPGQNAVGKYFHIADSLAIQIVGVIGDAHDHSITGTVARRVYYPYIHSDTAPGQLGQSQNLRIEVRTAGDPAKLVQAARRAVLSVDASLPIDGIDPVSRLMGDSISQQRLLAQLAAAFGLLALALAAIGLYGVMNYSITRRTAEIGLRMAMGAGRRQVMSMVLRESLSLVAAGTAVGLPLALTTTRLLRTQLHGVAPTDPLSIGVSILVLAASAVLAVMVPTLRAARLSPMNALRLG